MTRGQVAALLGILADFRAVVIPRLAPHGVTRRDVVDRWHVLRVQAREAREAWPPLP